MMQPTFQRWPCYMLGLSLAVSSLLASAGVTTSEASLRRSAIVRAVSAARPSIVNIQGQKTVSDDYANADGGRRVNGMGTGVVIDHRGYVVTNYHVVEGVRQIRVTMADGSAHTARLVSHDPTTDLAVIRIPTTSELPIIRIGTSQDLMEGEEVIAVGNAYGYPHTVTRGIISSLHRTVQVSNEQKYYDLIQTDASINPGNSGGPLLNIDGEMIGINVAVRVGAQGIGFAIPVDTAMEVASRLLSAERVSGVWHGVVTDPLREVGSGVYTHHVQEGSPAASAGVAPGDVITQVNHLPIQRNLDIERALLGVRPGQEVQVAFRRDGRPMQVSMQLATVRQRTDRSTPSVVEQVWEVFGLRLSEVPSNEFRRYRSQFNGGLRVVSVRPASAAAQQGIRPGDILVGMHKWETVSLDNVAYIMQEAEVRSHDPLKFYILRGNETLFGHLPVAALR